MDFARGVSNRSRAVNIALNCLFVCLFVGGEEGGKIYFLTLVSQPDSLKQKLFLEAFEVLLAVTANYTLVTQAPLTAGKCD